MSAKFKSTKKKQELEAEIDDWDASEEEEQQQPQPQSISQAQHQQSHHTKVYQDAWGDDDSSTGRPKVEGRTLWEEANRQTPQAQPIVQNRSLPSNLLAPGLSNTSSTSTANTISNGGEYDSRPPPQILRRDKKAEQAAAEQAAALAAANAANKKKSMAEREKEYKQARERIFGIGGGTKSSPSQSRNGSGSDTGGRNSPNISVKGKKVG